MRTKIFKINLVMILLLGLVFAFNPTFVKADNVYLGISNQEIGDISQTNIISIKGINQFNNDYILKFQTGSGDLIQEDHRTFLIDTALLKKLATKNKTSYFLGAGYRYFYDQKSSFAEGGKINLNQLSLEFAGRKKIYGLTLHSSLKYSPIGSLQYQMQEPSNIKGWEASLEIVKPIKDNFSLNIEYSQGSYNNIKMEDSRFKYLFIGGSLNL